MLQVPTLFRVLLNNIIFINNNYIILLVIASTVTTTTKLQVGITIVALLNLYTKRIYWNLYIYFLMEFISSKRGKKMILIIDGFKFNSNSNF